MTTITLKTRINAPVEEVFDLSRNISFHQKSASQTNETALYGKTSGLINYGESVTWRGKHLGIYLKHTSKITTFERPLKFIDVMTNAHFTYFAHQHLFETSEGGTIMKDILTYKVPFGLLGRVFNNLILKKHLTKFLKQRNFKLKEELEK
ncbi:ligand-binding SRPBCC domain-containing protein [Marinirhabdus gelatinilytica]|uniref:Ligand-binding SRPBCC domain-containing protein n=2 Tax=Marinirhabdus gelatinilytica TaxID=1703343 RepID=A0A370Q7E2_9FLAO|nr:ligand-binding SRPBCC domain-containing protein [Marinirhabdus gelatinilytica]